MDIGEWLSGLGLDKYAATFAENEIDLDTMRHLNDDDLKELGLPMAPRRALPACCETPDLRKGESAAGRAGLTAHPAGSTNSNPNVMGSRCGRG